jgi:muramoyltetrapeptide carboxypeptidase
MTLGIVSPASCPDFAELDAGIAWLRAEGYQIVEFPHARDRVGFVAGSDEDRARDLTDAFMDPKIDGVLCSRGGYGCVRLLDHLDLDALAATGKWFGGYSDITTLHLALNRRGLITYHCPMATAFSAKKEPWVLESFRSALRGECAEVEGMPSGQVLRPGVAEGPVVGGCARLLCDAIGTDNHPDFVGKIVLVEDVNESPYRVDASLIHLRRSGPLDEAAGIVVGEFTGSDRDDDPTWRALVEHQWGSLKCPIMTHYPFGHQKSARSLALGQMARLDAEAGTLTYFEAACR